MKKLFMQSLIVIALISCSKKENLKATEEIKASPDCLCNELNMLKKDIYGKDFEDWKNVMKDGKLYSGNCIERDQNDTIIRKLEIKNGWVVRQIYKENVMGSKYIITQDMHYKQLQNDYGFTLNLSLLSVDDKFRFVSNYEDYKNGNLYNKWSIGAFQDYLSVSRYSINGDPINYWIEHDSTGTDMRSKPKCIKDPEMFKGANNEMDWKRYHISDKELYKTMDCLKDEMKPFNYWMVK